MPCSSLNSGIPIGAPAGFAYPGKEGRRARFQMELRVCVADLSDSGHSKRTLFGDIAPRVSHPSAIPLRLSNATYFYPNLVPICNRRQESLLNKAWNCRCSAVRCNNGFAGQIILSCLSRKEIIEKNAFLKSGGKPGVGPNSISTTFSKEKQNST
jgi:hypothetical protein